MNASGGEGWNHRKYQFWNVITQKNLTKVYLGLGHSGRKIAWISWENLCNSKEEGGKV